jgi:hypothetical protein
MKHTQTFVLALLGSGAVLVIVQFTIREQMNRCLPSDQRTGVRELFQNPFIRFGERGLLGRHASLYPRSRLPDVAFRIQEPVHLGAHPFAPCLRRTAPVLTFPPAKIPA